MLAKNCRDVLFILDGWDELPSKLRKDSIFHQLIQPELSQKNPLHESAVIVTSRPIASGDLHPVVSSRVEILGYTPKELKEYFKGCLEDDTKAVETLLERIQENPAVAGSCFLPLNACILVHLFKSFDNTLPTTQYGIFSWLILSCIYRHQNECIQHKHLSLESLDDLPKVIKEPFYSLCVLAYKGIMDHRVTFFSVPPNINTLGLLQGVESFVVFGKSVSYNFLHHSIQELLTAFYIARHLPASEQVSKFNKLFGKSRFSVVFQFYAAITKLQTPGISKAITRVATKCGVDDPTDEDRALLLSLLHCLYEAQDPSLCESVAHHLQHRLNLRRIPLNLSDCLCVGYFLSCVCKTTAGEFKVNLSQCSIGDQACKYLVSGLHRCPGTHGTVTTTLDMDLYYNKIKYEGASDISKLLQTDCICALNLDFNHKISDEGACIIAQKLKNTTSLRTLRLIASGIKSKSVECLSSSLTTNSSLEELYIVGAPCDDVMQQLAHALTINHTLKILHLGNCGMTDVGLESLAKSLQQNKSLEQLNICNAYKYKRVGTFNCSSYPNTITDKGLSTFTECLKKNLTLLKLFLPADFKLSIATMQEVVNEVRKRSGFVLIEVTVDGDTLAYIERHNKFLERTRMT